LRKPIRALRVHWPVLRMNDWVQYLIAHKPGLLLAGHDIGGDWQRTFTEFWAGYKEVDGSHPVFREGFDLGGCIPYHLHGDEGRGQLKMLAAPNSDWYAAAPKEIGRCHDPKYILLDFLHIYHIGYGMDAAASSIVLLCNRGHFGNARKLDDNLAEAYVDPHDRLLQLDFYMIKCANAFFQVLRKEGVLLKGNICTIARTAGHEMNVAYAALASETHRAGMQLFKYRPKYHLGVHIPLDIQYPTALNPW
ncbi:unnamed protein product, partial [Durusdinium trenchii]